MRLPVGTKFKMNLSRQLVTILNRLLMLFLLTLVLSDFVLFAQCARARRERKARSPKWWALARDGEQGKVILNSPQRITNSIRGYRTQVLSKEELRTQPLNKKQRKMIRKNPGSLHAITNGAKMAVAECQYQFRNRRWNCPTTRNMRGRSIFGKIVRTSSRETAFLYAITSAAVSHTISKACSLGQMNTCTCDYSRKGPSGLDWEWGGCNDNIHFGNQFAMTFVDAAERQWDQRYIVNLHNNEAGRLHVKSMMHRECKCHGMSGSCTVKICWMKLPKFRDVGHTLKSQFDGASKILVNNRGNIRGMYKSGYDVQLEPFNPDHKPPMKKDLVYSMDSSDFCTKNRKLGIKGTVGRECNKTSIGVDGCDLMCCGRGYSTQVKVELQRCSCTFHWCCQVKCRTCKTRKTIRTCL